MISVLRDVLSGPEAQERRAAEAAAIHDGGACDMHPQWMWVKCLVTLQLANEQA